MIIISFFTEEGTPKVGLSPTLNVADIEADTLAISGASMSGLASMSHAYYYDFASYDENKKYAITVDGGAALNDSDRYQFATNETENLETGISLLSNMEGGRWKIDVPNKQWVYYKEDNITEIARFDLFDADGNPSVETIYERRRV